MRSKADLAAAAMASNSETLKLLRFIFELKLCGELPVRHANSSAFGNNRTSHLVHFSFYSINDCFYEVKFIDAPIKQCQKGGAAKRRMTMKKRRRMLEK